MNQYRRWMYLALVGLALPVLGVLWTAFAPLQFGGQASYVILTGNSMFPLFSLDDLIILHPAPDYQVGDIVAYRHPDIGPIFHRIVAIQNDHYVFKGDHNTWIDSYQPVRADLLGKYWLSIPQAGKILRFMRNPTIFMFLAGAISILFLIPMLTKPSTHTKNVPLRRLPAAGGSVLSPSGLGRFKDNGFLALAILFFASLILALFAFTRPLIRQVHADIPIAHHGEFIYTAVGDTRVYDNVNVQPGDPVFRALTNQVDLHFRYQLTSDQPASITGVMRMDAELSDVNGWHRLIPLVADTSFNGTTAEIAGKLNLDQLQTLITQMESITGIKRLNYTVRILPQVTVLGSVANQTLNGHFAPELDFLLDDVQLERVPGDEVHPNSLTPEAGGLVQRIRQEANSLPVLGLTLPVSLARVLALSGLALAVLGLALIVTLVQIAAEKSEPARIQVTYGALITDVHEAMLGVGANDKLVDIADMAELARLAERDNHLILHEKRGTVHSYYLPEGNLTYRYICQAADANQPAPWIVLETDLRWALLRQQFDVYYQPIFAIDRDGIVAVEALARLRHLEKGLLPASDILPVAEKAGLMVAITDMVLRKACMQAVAWRQTGWPGLELAVNISAYQLSQPYFPEDLRKLLAQVGLPVTALRLEVNDSDVASQLDDAQPQLKRLEGMGVQLALHYSGAIMVDQLGRLPFRYIKFEPGMLQNLAAGPARDALLESLAALVRSQGKQLVALRIETPEQLVLMRDAACDSYQGNLKAAPMSVNELTRFLHENMPAIVATGGER